MSSKLKNAFFIITGILLILGIIAAILNARRPSAQPQDEVATEKKIIRMLFGINQEDFETERIEVKNGQTFSDLLKPYNIDAQQVEMIVQRAMPVFDVRKIRAGKNMFFFMDRDTASTLRYFVYEINPIEYVKFDLGDSIEVKLNKLPVRKDTVISEGIINSSLWMTMKESGADINLAIELSNIYAWAIDFYGIQKGDAFKVYYVKNYVDTTYVGIERIIAAKFTHFGKDYFAFEYMQDSAMDYFDEQGNSLKRAFLKAPLKFSRISSHFSNSRLHPVLKIRRPHHGVDYSAPPGTPVFTIGDGVVTEAHWAGGYGNRVVVKHNGTYTTGYAHLKGYAKGIRKGTRVRQGEVIGYVGSTGLSTGPHLDFRVYKNGKPIDPLNVESPPAIPIHKQNIEAYNAFIKSWTAKLK